MTLKLKAISSAIVAWAVLSVSAQTLTFTNGLQIYVGFTNTTVTMSNQCGLVVTGTNNPIAGSTINLNSTDAWFFLPNLHPSVVSASYLSRVMVNGAAAVAGSNCRVDQYLMGAVIVPHPPSLKPLQVFSGPNFLGLSTNLGIYTYYTNAALGPLWWNISSFTLKRGYSVTFAQNADGTGASRVYVAQDGDLQVGVMPTNLDHQCSFVRVFPWRWVGKKGWAGGIDSNVAKVNPLWNYDWGNGATSSLDAEYCPMQWGGGYTTGINGKQASTGVLGYNEPDSTAQANLTVAQALAYWPMMMQSGLRVGAPAVSDSGVTGQGLDWIYSFMSQATNLGYRVDFIPIHWYKCGQNSSQLLSYLTAVYQATGKPIWLTEFNYGANWCDSSSSLPPTPGQEASAITQFLSVLESAPFVERYSIYNWVTTNREMVLDNGSLSPAGVVYANQQSGMAYTQTLPPGGSRSIAQYEFENNTLDSSGYANHGLAAGIPSYTTGHTGQALALDGTNNYIQLPPNIANSAGFTFAAWVYWNGGANWQRIFDFGRDTSHYLFLSPSSGGGTLRFAINNGGGEQIIETTGMPSGVWQHVAVTLSGNSARLYVNGVLAASSSSFTIAPSSFNPNLNYLGKSQFSADLLFHGNLDEVQIADYAFTPAQIAALQTDTPPQFTTNILAGGAATQQVAYSGSIAGTATDPDPGDTLTCTKAGGPAWLVVGTDGTLSGTPGPTDGGTNNFTVRVTDAAGASAFAMLTIIVPFTTGNSLWFYDGNGTWSDTGKWARRCVANGAGLTADFTTVNLAANRTVILDSSRSIGTLKFADFWGSQTWTLVAPAGILLTLDTGSAASPSIVVGTTAPTFATSNTGTIIASLAGTNGFSKSGWGTLILTGGNPLSGTLNVDSGSAAANDGAVRLAAASAATNITAIAIRNNNGGSSTLQLANGIVLPIPVTVSGRNTNVAAIENISASNSISGAISMNSGGGNYIFQSDAGTLNFGGVISSAISGTRTFTFQGAGDHFLSGSIQNGGATTLNVIKQDAGNLILANTNAFTGGMSVGGGSVKLNYDRALENNLVNLDCAGSNALKFGPIIGATVAGLSGINDVWLTSDSLAAVTLTNGNNNASSEFAGALKGSGSLMKIGAGTFTLDATNAYTGATTIAAGKVRFGSATNFIASLQPVLWMSFDQAGGGTVTNQGKGGWAMNGTIIGSGAYVTGGGRFGNALYINGSGGTAEQNIVLINSKVVDTSVSGSWSLGYWIKTTTAGAVVLYQGDGSWTSGQTAYLLNAGSGSTAGTAAGAVRWGGGFLAGTTAVNDGNWHFITIVDSAGTESIYVDGNVDAVTSTMTGALASGANQMWIGGAPDTDAGAVKITGLIDELCIFDRALTQAQIRSIITNTPASGKLPAASAVNLASGGTLDLSGYSQSVASLADYNGGGGTVTNGGAAPVTLTLGGASGSNVFSGIIADGAAASAISLVNNGAATEVLAGANVFRGTTTVNNGALIINGSIGNNSVTVTGGTLGGNGVIGGPVTIQSGGTLSPGNSIGLVTINNTLTLNGTTFIELNKAVPTNDAIQGTSTVNYGGTLTVTNLGGTLAAGDSFTIFHAANYNGSFATLNLPAPGVGLAWNMDGLTNGFLSIVATLPPQFGSIAQLGDGNFQFSGSGAAGVIYELDATTNLASPIDWSFVTNALADQNGLFQFADLQATNFPQRFYRIIANQ